MCSESPQTLFHLQAQLHAVWMLCEKRLVPLPSPFFLSGFKHISVSFTVQLGLTTPSLLVFH